MLGNSNSIIAIVGASGLVGRECLAILAERGVASTRIVALASSASSGLELPFGESSVRVEALAKSRLHECDSVIFCTNSHIAESYAMCAASAGLNVVDHSSAFRENPEIALVIPEINGNLLANDLKGQIVANPNCSTIILLMVLAPLLRLGSIRHVSVSTYQAASGAGAAALEELRLQNAAAQAGAPPKSRIFPEPLAMNVFPHESKLDELSGNNKEENKMIRESRRILALPELDLLPTSIRVPVERAHSQSIVVEYDRAPSLEAAQLALESWPGIELMRGSSAGSFPTPLKASHRDEILVGRLRIDPNAKRLALWVCGDQLRKGAALNAVQILERLDAPRSPCD